MPPKISNISKNHLSSYRGNAFNVSLPYLIGDQMSQAIALPIVDLPEDISPGDRSFENKQIERLCSTNQMAREFAADWLCQNGDSVTADKLENLINERKLPHKSMKAAGRILLSLSNKHRDFAGSTQRRLRRFMTINKAILSRH